MPISDVHLYETFRYLYSYSGEILNSLKSQLILSVVLGFLQSLYTLPEYIVAIAGVHLSQTFMYFQLLIRRGSELFGVSAQTDRGIRVSAVLIYPTSSYCAYF